MYLSFGLMICLDQFSPTYHESNVVANFRTNLLHISQFCKLVHSDFFIYLFIFLFIYLFFFIRMLLEILIFDKTNE